MRIPSPAEQLRQNPLLGSQVRQDEQFWHDPYPFILKVLLGQASHKLFEPICSPELQLRHSPVEESHSPQLELQAIQPSPSDEKVNAGQSWQS